MAEARARPNPEQEPTRDAGVGGWDPWWVAARLTAGAAFRAAFRLRVRGRALLLRGAQPHIRTLIELVGLHRLPGVRFEGSSPALA